MGASGMSGSSEKPAIEISSYFTARYSRTNSHTSVRSQCSVKSGCSVFEYSWNVSTSRASVSARCRITRSARGTSSGGTLLSHTASTPAQITVTGVFRSCEMSAINFCRPASSLRRSASLASSRSAKRSKLSAMRRISRGPPQSPTRTLCPAACAATASFSFRSGRAMRRRSHQMNSPASAR